MRFHSFTALSALSLLAASSCGQLPSEGPTSTNSSSIISLESTRIDIKNAGNDIPEALRIQAGDTAAERIALVKYPAPIDSDQDQLLRSVVARVYTYLPEFTYLVRLPEGMKYDELREATGASWVGPYHPQYKLSRALSAIANSDKAVASTDGPRIVMVHVYPDVNVEEVAERIQGLGVKEIPGQGRGTFFSKIRLLLTDDEVVGLREKLAQIPEVFWLDVESRRVLLNDTTIWVGQSGVNAGQSTPVFTNGIYGQGQIVAVLDTGIDPDMCYFRDPALGLPPRNECNGGTVVDMAQRKVIAVDFLSTTECNGGIANNEWDNQDHGTHVAGTVAGDNFAMPLLHDAGDGMAPGAKLIIQDGGYAVNACADLPGIGCPVVDLNPIFQQTYDQGARIHTNSWGDNENAAIQNDYSAATQDSDEFMWNHKDFLILYAAGNSGPGDTSVSTPSTAKSVLSVGSTLRGTSANTMSTFSSCGPTDDGRYKPEIVVPGSNIVSANSDNSTTTNNCNTRTMSGTSMATPGAAGFAALVRQYYMAGFYPSGIVSALDGFTPSAALIRATMVNSGARVANATPMPGNCQGWGRVTLDDTLYFAPQVRQLWVKDDTAGFAQGSTNETQSYKFTVHGAAMSLKATLAWTDYPSTPAAMPHINNDLDLEVVGPDGTYLGNVFAMGESTTGGNPDRLNTLEQVLLSAPMPGEYTVTVRSFNVPNGPQPWALIVTGDASIEGSLGASCATAADCGSGFCADGVCCNTACDAGACDACASAAGANKDGTCRLLSGTSCDDGNACTQTDTCNVGVCSGANPVVCPMGDACHDMGTCDPMTGMCSNPAKADGTVCDDNDACSQGDACVAGTCTGGTFVQCMASDACHDAGTCDPATGACSNPEKPEGASCDDGNGCTVGDNCIAGVCNAGTAMTCTAQDECHDAGVCDSATGMCSNPAKPDGTVCSTGECVAGVCTSPSTSSSSSSGTGGAAGAGGNGASGGTGGMSEASSSSTGGRPSLDLGEDGGCGCRVAANSDRGYAWVGLGLFLAAWRRQRKNSLKSA